MRSASGCDPVEAAPKDESRALPELIERIGLELIAVPAGEFLMGTAPPEKEEESWVSDFGAAQADTTSREIPQRTVRLDAYEIAKYPVTAAQYEAFSNATGHAAPANTSAGPPAAAARLPACFVSWADAAAFCRWLVAETGEIIRLPTEAEWERAARGDDGRTHPWGEGPPTTWLCNYAGEVGGLTDVRSYPAGASPWGCVDMAGNVWEWCADWFDPSYYEHGVDENPTGPATGFNRVIRGGAYDSDQASVRCAARYYNRPDTTPFFPCGFRIALVTPR